MGGWMGRYSCLCATASISPRRTSPAVRKMVPVSVRVSLVKITVCCYGLHRVTSSAGITQGAAGGTLSVVAHHPIT